MTLREALGADVQRIYEQVEALLDREDGVVALFDGVIGRTKLLNAIRMERGVR